MSDAHTGGCACGAIRYEIGGQPLAMVDCQCPDCQRASGTGHGSYLTFGGRDRVHLRSEAAQWTMLADSGSVKRLGFCPACGAPVYLTSDAMPDLFTVHAASLDDPGRYRPIPADTGRYRPQMTTFHARGHAWDHPDPATPKFDRMPPA